MNEKDALLQAIRANLADDSLRLIYADWLEDHGEAEEAEFVRLDCELDRMKEIADQDRQPAEREKLARLHALWPVRYTQCPLVEALEVRRGVPERIIVEGRQFLKNASAIWQFAPTIHEVRLDRIGRKIAALAACPQLAQIDALHLRDSRIGSNGVRQFVDSPWLGGLRRLDLSDNAVGPAGAEALAACPRLDQLEELRLGGNNIRDRGAEALLGARRLSRLRHLDLYGNRLSDRTALALERADHLNQLAHLQIGYNQIGLQGAQALARAAHLANLEVLGLAGAPLGDASVQALLRSPHLQRLSYLDLSHNPIGEPAVQALRERFGDRFQPRDMV